MSKLVEQIINKNYEMANEALSEQFQTILERKMCEMKKMTAAKMTEVSHDERMKRLRTDVLEDNEESVKNLIKEYGAHEVRLPPISADGSASPDRLKKIDTMMTSKSVPGAAPTAADKQSAANLEEARINIIKARIRGGVIQRRKKVSNVAGMTIRGGKLTRMSAAERRRRKLGARKAQLKTRGKQVQIQRNRKISLVKRKRLGL